jgi:hypothetical protein
MGQISVLRLDGTQIGTVKNLNQIGQWMPGFKPVSGNVFIHRSSQLPVMNNGSNRKFKKLAEGIFQTKCPVPAVLVEFTSNRKKRCYAIAPHDLTTPA